MYPSIVYCTAIIYCSYICESVNFVYQLQVLHLIGTYQDSKHSLRSNHYFVFLFKIRFKDPIENHHSLIRLLETFPPPQDKNYVCNHVPNRFIACIILILIIIPSHAFFLNVLQLLQHPSHPIPTHSQRTLPCAYRLNNKLLHVSTTTTQ